MQTTQTNENSSQVQTSQGVFRQVAAEQQAQMMSAHKAGVYLVDGNSIKFFEFSSNCRALPKSNHLVNVSYIQIDEQNIIDSYSEPCVQDLAMFYGFSLMEKNREIYTSWNLALQRIESCELNELMTFFRKGWNETLLTDHYEGSFCILEPSTICDYDNIINTLDCFSFVNSTQKNQALIGGYLFCVYRSYYKILRDGILNIAEHRNIIGAIEHLILRLEQRNYRLASTLRQYCRVAALNTSHDITEFDPGAQLVWDLFQHFQPALDRQAEKNRLIKLHGLD